MQSSVDLGRKRDQRSGPTDCEQVDAGNANRLVECVGPDKEQEEAQVAIERWTWMGQEPKYNMLEDPMETMQNFIVDQIGAAVVGDFLHLHDHCPDDQSYLVAPHSHRKMHQKGARLGMMSAPHEWVVPHKPDSDDVLQPLTWNEYQKNKEAEMCF